MMSVVGQRPDQLMPLYALAGFAVGITGAIPAIAVYNILKNRVATLVLQVVMTRSDGKQAAVTTQTHLVLDWNGKE